MNSSSVTNHGFSNFEEWAGHAKILDENCMPIILEDARVEDLAAELARRTGETIAEAIRVALYQRLQLLDSQQREIGMREKAAKILKRIDALPTEDHRSEDEILGYDSMGLPR